MKNLGIADRWDWEGDQPRRKGTQPFLTDEDIVLIAEALAFYVGHLSVRDPLLGQIAQLQDHLCKCCGAFDDWWAEHLEQMEARDDGMPF